MAAPDDAPERNAVVIIVNSTHKCLLLGTSCMHGWGSWTVFQISNKWKCLRPIKYAVFFFISCYYGDCCGMRLCGCHFSSTRSTGLLCGWATYSIVFYSTSWFTSTRRRWYKYPFSQSSAEFLSLIHSSDLKQICSPNPHLKWCHRLHNGQAFSVSWPPTHLKQPSGSSTTGLIPPWPRKPAFKNCASFSTY